MRKGSCGVGVGVVVGCVFAAALSGCASFRAEKVSRVTLWPPPQVLSPKTLRVELFVTRWVNDRPEEVGSRTFGAWKDEALEAYRSSGLFSVVTASMADTDLRAEIQVEERIAFDRVMRVVSALTVFIVPSREITEVTVKTTLRNRQGELLAEVKSSETINTWSQLFLVFYTPFSYPSLVRREVMLDLNRAAVVQARAVAPL